jgi:hypothetical protein
MKDRRLEKQLRAASDRPAPTDLQRRLDAAIPGSFGRPRTVRIAEGVIAMTKWGMIAAVPAVLALWFVSTIILGPTTPVAFAGVLEPVVAGTSDAALVHYILHRLTREGEDFSFVELDGPGLTVDVWVEAPQPAGEPVRYRMAKSDRVVAYDGKQTLLHMTKTNEAYRYEGINTRGAALWPAGWISELRERPGEGVKQLLYEEVEGEARLVYSEPGADTSPLPKAFLGDYDRETELRWSLDTHALTGMKIWILVGGKRVLYSELLAIEYLPVVEPEWFEIALSDNVRFGGVKEGTPAENALGPADVARGLFEAAQRKDQHFLETYVTSPAAVDWAMQAPPFEILYIGEPFRTGRYVGVYVPYKIRVDGEIREWQVALRNDNPERRWVLDGGI